MIPKVKCISGVTINTGDIVRFPFGKGDDKRFVYAVFEGVHGNSRVRNISMALTKTSGRGSRAVSVLNILDGDAVVLGRSCIVYSKGVPMTLANATEIEIYKAKATKAIKEHQKTIEK